MNEVTEQLYTDVLLLGKAWKAVSNMTYIYIYIYIYIFSFCSSGSCK